MQPEGVVTFRFFHFQLDWTYCIADQCALYSITDSGRDVFI
jgi:hypothetical protein